jgi:hypothetical protein
MPCYASSPLPPKRGINIRSLSKGQRVKLVAIDKGKEKKMRVDAHKNFSRK